MRTDLSEKGLETLIVRAMTGTDGLALAPSSLSSPSGAIQTIASEASAPWGGTGFFPGNPKDFDRAHALDVYQLFAFLRATQPEVFKKLAMLDAADAKDINRLKFLTRLSSEIGKRGVIDVLRKGIEHHPAGHFDLFYGTPSEGNAKSQALHAQNRFVVTRQFAYSVDEARRALDLGWHKGEPELDRLSQILKTFNDNFGTLFDDGDRVAKRFREDIAPKVAADAAYQNARKNTPHTARMAHDQALGKAMQIVLKEDTHLYKLFVENDSFRRSVGDMVYAMTNQR